METSTDAAPVVTYAAEGTYTVKVTAQNASGEAVAEKENLITISSTVTGDLALLSQGICACFGALSDDGKILYGCVNSREYTCRFDGGAYKLGGIGGVSTLPPYRHNGAIRAGLSASLRDMYEKGFTVSYLFPFSTRD